MKIKSIRVNADFRYLWLKTVRDVDLNQHCAKCLIGQYDSRIGVTVREAHDIELQDQVYYLCGVAKPFNWARNFHLAFRPCPGSTVKYQSNGITVEIEDAERLPISQDYLDIHHPKAHLKAYYTCRNYQFAHWFSKSMSKQPVLCPTLSYFVRLCTSMSADFVIG